MFETIINAFPVRYILGPKKLTRLLGLLSNAKIPSFILRPFLKTFIKKYEIDVSQYEIDLGSVKTFTEFFIRKFKDGQRQFEGSMASPAESVITNYGLLNANTLMSIKGMKCTLSDLLKEKNILSYKSYSIFYLSPADYHRFHAPFDLRVKKITNIPGKLFSVKPKTVSKFESLYCQNKRMVLTGESQFGNFAIVLVGALIVGKIIVNFSGNNNLNEYWEENTNVELKQGDEIGRFEMGSTLVMFMDSDLLSNIQVERGKHVLIGQSLLN